MEAALEQDVTHKPSPLSRRKEYKCHVPMYENKLSEVRGRSIAFVLGYWKTSEDEILRLSQMEKQFHFRMFPAEGYLL